MNGTTLQTVTKTDRGRAADGSPETCLTQGYEPAREFYFAGGEAFQKNQGLLLSGALAYYTLLSVIPLFTFLLLMLSHVVDEAALISSSSSREQEWMMGIGIDYALSTG